jgi:hypothetical protein
MYTVGNHGLGHDHISFFWKESIFQMGFYFFIERDLKFEHVFWYIFEAEKSVLFRNGLMGLHKQPSLHK